MNLLRMEGEAPAEHRVAVRRGPSLSQREAFWRSIAQWRLRGSVALPSVALPTPLGPSSMLEPKWKIEQIRKRPIYQSRAPAAKKRGNKVDGFRADRIRVSAPRGGIR